MISFFRKFRKKSVGGNNAMKYLLYALGEMVLIILGILIALQVNNYNEQKKKETTRYQLLMQLKEENQRNLNDLAMDSLYRDTLIEKLVEFHTFLKTKKIENYPSQVESYLAFLGRNRFYTFANKYLNKYIASYADDNTDFTEELINLDYYQNSLEYLSNRIQDLKVEKMIYALVDEVDIESLEVYSYETLKSLEFRNNIWILKAYEQENYYIYTAALNQQMVVDSILRQELP